MLIPLTVISKIIILQYVFALSIANLTFWQEIENEWKTKVYLSQCIKKISIDVHYVTFITNVQLQDMHIKESNTSLGRTITNKIENNLIKQAYATDFNNEIRTYDWNATKCYGIYSMKNKYQEKDMIGVDIRVTTIYNPPLTMLKKNGTNEVLTGFIGDIWHDIQGILNFRYTISTPVDGTFGSIVNDECKISDEKITQNITMCRNWSGMVGQIFRGEADVVATPLTLTKDRLQVLHFSSPLIYTSEQLFIRLISRPPPSHIFYMQPFSVSLWLTFAITVFLLLPIMHAMLCWFAPICDEPEQKDNINKRKIKLVTNERHLCDKDMASYFHWLSESLGIFCQQGLQYAPHSLAVRLTLCITLLSSSIIYNVYSGSLASFLAVERQIKPPFSSLKDLLHPQSGFSIGVLGNSSLTMILSSHTEGLYKYAWDRINSTKSGIVATRLEGFHRACTEKFAFFTLEASYEGFRKELLPCELFDIPELNFNGYMGITMSKEFPYAPIIDDIILRMNEVGLLNRQHLRWWPPYHEKEYTYAAAQKDSVEADASDPVMKISVDQVTFAFELLLTGSLLSLLILVGEIIYVRYECCKPFQFI